MNFLGFANLLGFLGLLSLPIIFALHLFRERSNQFIVSSLSLWAFLDDEVRGSRFSRIPITWLLILDLLIALLLSFAWAQPLISVNSTTNEARHLIFLIDVSTSMQARDVLPDRLSQSKLQLIAMLGDLGPNDIATVVTFGKYPHWIGDTRETVLQELTDEITDLHAAGVGHALKESLVLAMSSLNSQLPSEIHIFTDASYPDPDLGFEDLSIKWHLLGQETSNQAVLDISVEEINEDEYQVYSQVGNFGNYPVDQLITLLADGIPVDSTAIRMDPESAMSQIWTVSGRPTAVSVMVSSDKLNEDNIASVGLQHTEVIRVGLVTDEPDPIDRALNSIEGVELRILSPEEYIVGMPFDFVIFRGYLPDEWPSGTVLVFDPPATNNLLEIEGSENITSVVVPDDDSLLSDIDFSGVRWSNAWGLSEIPEGFKPTLQTADLPIFLQGKIEASHINIFLADLKEGNFTQHPSFPVFIAGLVSAIGKIPLPTHLALDDELIIPNSIDYPIVRIVSPEGDSVEFQEDRPGVWQEALEPGVYTFELFDFSGVQYNFATGVNAGGKEESDIRPQKWAADQASLSDEGQTIVNQEINLMPWLLSLAIVLLFLEARLAWR